MTNGQICRWLFMKPKNFAFQLKKCAQEKHERSLNKTKISYCFSNHSFNELTDKLLCKFQNEFVCIAEFGSRRRVESDQSAVDAGGDNLCNPGKRALDQGQGLSYASILHQITKIRIAPACACIATLLVIQTGIESMIRLKMKLIK